MSLFFHGEFKSAHPSEFIPVLESVMKTPLIVKQKNDSIYDFRNASFHIWEEGTYHVSPLFPDKYGHYITFNMKIKKEEDNNGYHITIKSFIDFPDYEKYFHFLMKATEIYGYSFYTITSDEDDDFKVEKTFDMCYAAAIQDSKLFSRKSCIYTADIFDYMKVLEDTKPLFKKAYDIIDVYVKDEMDAAKEKNKKWKNQLYSKADIDYYPYSAYVYEKYLCVLNYLMFHKRNNLGLDYFLKMHTEYIKKYHKYFLKLYCSTLGEKERNDMNDEYIVSIAVNSRVNIPVSANSPKEAKEKALSKFAFSDLGDIAQEVIDYQAVNATDKNGNLTDF